MAEEVGTEDTAMTGRFGLGIMQKDCGWKSMFVGFWRGCNHLG